MIHVTCLLAILGIGAAGPPQGAKEVRWVRYAPPTAPGLFSVEHPTTWSATQPEGAGYIEIANAEENAAFFVMAVAKPGGTLEQFATVKFGTQADVFKRVAAPSQLKGRGWTGLLEEALDKDGTRRVTLCAGPDTQNPRGLFVSATLYADSGRFVSKRAYYERLFTSLVIGELP